MHIKKWVEFATKRGYDSFAPPLALILDFLTLLFHRGLSYSSINTARSALSTYISVDGQPMGVHPLVRRFMKGVFQLRPALPKHNVIWDTTVVLDYIKKLSPVKVLTLKRLTFKLVMLIALLTGQRCQTMHALTVANTTVTDSCVKFRVNSLLKQSRLNYHLHELKIKAYAPDRRRCIVTVIREYLKRTENIRTSDNLLISYVKPFKAVSRDTISRWVKTVLGLSGVDTTIFTAHSTRAAATTSAKGLHVPLNTIMRTAGWSNSNTFAKYYDKTEVPTKDFAEEIQNKAMR